MRSTDPFQPSWDLLPPGLGQAAIFLKKKLSADEHTQQFTRLTASTRLVLYLTLSHTHAHACHTHMHATHTCMNVDTHTVTSEVLAVILRIDRL